MSPLAADKRPGRCVYCGRPCNGQACQQHADLLTLEASANDNSGGKPVDTVDSHA